MLLKGGGGGGTERNKCTVKLNCKYEKLRAFPGELNHLQPQDSIAGFHRGDSPVKADDQCDSVGLGMDAKKL